MLAMIVLSLASSGVLAAWAHGDDVRELEARGHAAMRAGDYDTARELYERLAREVPESFVPRYNLACALARLGDEGGAVDALEHAVVLGFTDRFALQNDPDLAPIRGTPFYAELLDRWPDILDARREADLVRAVAMMRTAHERRTLDELRIELVSAHDPVSTDQAAAELDNIASWATRTIFKGLDAAPARGQNWVMVVLPEKTGYASWAVATFGRGAIGSVSSIGGAYEHQQRRLVARDLGATLRHEFVHVLHWRDMTRLGQEHAAWIQEGLASLVEDTDPGPGATPIPAPSWRTNMVKRMLRVGELPTLAELAAHDMRRFTARRPLAKYAHARTVLMFLHQRGELSAFYDAYTRHYDDDPSGLDTLQLVTDMELGDLERAYRDWVERLPAVPETGADLDATLGIAIKEGSGDGVVVRDIPSGLRAQSGIRLGSVITMIDGRPTRDLHEFIRVLGTKQPGQTVTIHHRWGRVHARARVTLRAR